MKSYLWLVCVGILVFLTGCDAVTSLRPLYTDKDLVFEPALVGTWSEEDSNKMWIFSKGDKKEYNLVMVNESGEREKRIVYVVKVEGGIFLDFFSAHPEKSSSYQLIHTFVRVDQIEPTFQMAALNYDWIKVFLRLYPDAIGHEKVGTDIILTAETKELQTFLVKHKKDAFEESIQMLKKNRNMYLLNCPK